MKIKKFNELNESIYKDMDERDLRRIKKYFL
jgi:hypothetical protein